MSEKTKQKSIIYKDFSVGMDIRKSHGREGGICKMVNLCPLPDGSITKRDGYSLIHSASSPIRALWGGNLEGTYACFYVTNSSVYHLDVVTGVAALLSTLAYFEGTPCFFYFKDTLYLYTETAFYKVTKDTVTQASGYIPLYGKEWGTTLPGEINEPVNLVNGYVRITYIVPDPHSVLLPVFRPIKSVFSIHKNGVLLDTDSYSIDTRYNSITVPGIVPGDKLTAFLEFDVSSEREKLFSSHHMAVFGGINNCRLFMWGSNDKSLMFASSFVDDKAIKESQALLESSDALYFPEGYEFAVGSGRYAITSVLRHYDRLLIFTENDAWMADTSGCGLETFPVMNINSVVGCSSASGSDKDGNSPVTAWQNGIYRWTSDTDELNDCNAYLISQPLGELPSGYTKKCVVFKNPYNSELLIYNPDFGTHIFVYNTEQNSWYKYSGIENALDFFDADGTIGFYDSSSIYRFSNDLCYDLPDGTTHCPIDAFFEIEAPSFGTNDKKRLSAITVHGENGSIYMEILLDNGQQVNKSFVMDCTHNIYKKRLFSDRFNFLRHVKITMDNGDNNTRQIIHAIQIDAR